MSETTTRLTCPKCRGRTIEWEPMQRFPWLDGWRCIAPGCWIKVFPKPCGDREQIALADLRRANPEAEL